MSMLIQINLHLPKSNLKNLILLIFFQCIIFIYLLICNLLLRNKKTAVDEKFDLKTNKNNSSNKNNNFSSDQEVKVFEGNKKVENKHTDSARSPYTPKYLKNFNFNHLVYDILF